VRDALNEHTLFAMLAMIRAESASHIYVLEGDDDAFALKPHASGEVRLIPGNGRPITLRTAELAHTRGLSAVTFLVDADYDRFVQPDPYYPRNVITSEHHDVIMDLIFGCLSAIDRVIDAHCRAARRSGQCVEDAANLRDAALVLASRIALLRILNEKERLTLNLSDFPFGSLSSTEASFLEIAEVAVGRSAVSYDPDNLAQKLAGLELTTGPCLALPGDHDFFGALGAVLRSQGVRNASKTALESSYLAAISCSSIVGAGWFSRVMENTSTSIPRPFSCPCPT
jgi:hypothetical protein